jgi:hypothetical protein
MMPRTQAEAAACNGARQKRGERSERCRDRKVLCVGDGKSQERDIPGHIGHKHVTQLQITNRIDQSRDHGKYEKQRHERAMSFVMQE